MKRMAGTLTTIVSLSLAASCGREVESTGRLPDASEEGEATVAEAGRDVWGDGAIDVTANDAGSDGNEAPDDATADASPTDATVVDGSVDASGVGVGDGGDAGAPCEAGATQCSGRTPQTCVNGRWQSGTACSALCDQGTCVLAAPNCFPGGPGLTDCGASSESCCASLDVPGGTYFRTYDMR
jgi:hypothetical protein